MHLLLDIQGIDIAMFCLAMLDGLQVKVFYVMMTILSNKNVTSFKS